MLIRKPSDIPSSEITPQKSYNDTSIAAAFCAQPSPAAVAAGAAVTGADRLADLSRRHSAQRSPTQSCRR